MKSTRSLIIGVVVLTTVIITVGWVLIFKLEILKSQKGERAFVLYEARELQMKLRKSGPNHLQESIDEIARKTGSTRWRVSKRSEILIETVYFYKDFRDVNNQSMWYYCLDQQFHLILIDEKGQRSKVHSTYFGTDESDELN